VYGVIMATRPTEPFILDALASIHAQTLPPAQVIVVVNGPGAHECDLRATIGEQFPEVVVRADDRPSMAAAFHVGLAGVRTPYVGFLDADDLWAPTKQERQITMLADSPRVDAVLCQTVNFRVDADAVVRDGVVATARLFGATTFRTDVFDRFGPVDADADHFEWLYRWWAGAAAAGIVTATDAFPGLRRRLHAGNGWVTQHERGRAVLLAELRRINRRRRGESVEAASAR